MKKMRVFPVFTTLVVLAISLLNLTSCKSSQMVAESKVESESRTTSPLQIAFEVEDSSAGNRGQEANLGPQNRVKGYGFYLSIEENKVSAALPCICPPTLSNGYKAPYMIFDDASLEHFTYQRYQDPREFTLRFEVKDQMDRHHFELHVNADKTAYMNLLSGRAGIVGYTGKVRQTL